MAQDKKTIIVYADWEEYFIDLSDEEAGKLIKHFFAYVNDKNPNLNDRFLDLAFKPIKLQLKRDLDKWEQIKLKRIEAGRAGGLRSGEVRSKQNEANEASASSLKQNEANEAVNVNDNDINNIITVSNESDTLLIDDKLPKSFNPIYFTIAKAYHNLFLKTKGENKTLLNVTTQSYVDTIRKLIELDGLTIEQLVAIKLFLEDGANRVRGVDTFWAETIYSVNSLRKKNKDGVFYYDMIAQKAKKWIEMDGNKARVKNAVEYVNSKQCKSQEENI